MARTPVPSNPPPPPAPGLRRYLYFTAAVTGAAIMIVEILGAPCSAPYIGTSHFVWTAQIAVTLVALATTTSAGAWWIVPRGWSACPGPSCSRPFILPHVPVVEPLAYWCLGFKLAVGSLLASALLYFVPLALLAMVGPFFVRRLTVAVGGVGGNVGRLTAISTLGSFAGTLLIRYIFYSAAAQFSHDVPHHRGIARCFRRLFFGLGSQAGFTSNLDRLPAGCPGARRLGLKRDQPLRRADWQELCRANSCA